MAMTGRCLCGDIKYLIEHAPAIMGVCHCKMCQRQAGSAFSTMAGVPTAQFTLVRGVPTTYRGRTESGNGAEISFCGRCGSPIFTVLPDQPDLLFLKAGTLDDTSWFRPQFHVWCDEKQDWVSLNDDAPMRSGRD